MSKETTHFYFFFFYTYFPNKSVRLFGTNMEDIDFYKDYFVNEHSRKDGFLSA